MSNGDDSEARDETRIRSVDRAVAILDLLAREGWSAGAEVARELGVHRSTALRLLATLDRHGLVERDARTSKYRLGRRLVQLASSVRGEVDLRQVARPVCEALARALGETVTLDVLDGDEIVPIEQATGSTSVVSVSWLGTRSPVHCTASGKVILAFAPVDMRARLARSPHREGPSDSHSSRSPRIRPGTSSAQTWSTLPPWPIWKVPPRSRRSPENCDRCADVDRMVERDRQLFRHAHAAV